MSGGKGGSTTSSVQIPDWAQDAAKKNIAMGEYASQLGYMPYYGLDVAAQTPAQQAANQNFASAVSAFGGQAPVDMNAGMPTAQTIDGVTGYSSGSLFDSALAELAQRRPAQYQAYNDMFINPQTGEQGVLFTPAGSVATPSAGVAANAMANYSSDGDSIDLSGASKTNTQKIMDSLKMNQFAKDYPVLAPGGFLVHGSAGLNDWLTRQSVPTYTQGGGDGSGGSWSLSPENAAGQSGLTWTGSGGNTFSTNKTYNDTSGLSSTGTWDFTQD